METLNSPEAVRALMERYGISPLKRYGQNFLTDAAVADRIAAFVPEGADVLEIGPGLGALTARLAARTRVVAAYEIDKGLVRALRDEFSGTSNVTIFHEDFLKAELEAELSPLFAGEVYVAANLPYYITTDCIMKLLQARLKIKRMALMVQKEFAQRICAQPGEPDYGAAGAAVAYFTSPKVVFSVPPSSFYPRPGVSSSVLLLDLGEYGREQADRYLKTVKGLFSMRRKTVKSNLRQAFNLSAEEAEAVAKGAGVDPGERAERLGAEQIKRISDLL